MPTHFEYIPDHELTTPAPQTSAERTRLHVIPALGKGMVITNSDGAFLQSFRNSVISLERDALNIAAHHDLRGMKAAGPLAIENSKLTKGPGFVIEPTLESATLDYDALGLEVRHIDELEQLHRKLAQVAFTRSDLPESLREQVVMQPLLLQSFRAFQSLHKLRGY